MNKHMALELAVLYLPRSQGRSSIDGSTPVAAKPKKVRVVHIRTPHVSVLPKQIERGKNHVVPPVIRRDTPPTVPRER